MPGSVEKLQEKQLTQKVRWLVAQAM